MASDAPRGGDELPERGWEFGPTSLEAVGWQVAAFVGERTERRFVDVRTSAYEELWVVDTADAMNPRERRLDAAEIADERIETHVALAEALAAEISRNAARELELADFSIVVDAASGLVHETRVIGPPVLPVTTHMAIESPRQYDRHVRTAVRIAAAKAREESRAIREQAKRARDRALDTQRDFDSRRGR